MTPDELAKIQEGTKIVVREKLSRTTVEACSEVRDNFILRAKKGDEFLIVRVQDILKFA